MKKNFKKVYMWYKVKELSQKGLNKSQISREIGIDRGTVRRYLQIQERDFHKWLQKPRCLPKKLMKYYNYVKIVLESQPYLSAAQIEDRLKEHFTDLPCVHSKTVYNFVQSIRKEHGILKQKGESTRDYQKLPELAFGKQAQVDFGQYHMQTSTGKRCKVYFFVMVLCRSRQKFVYFQAMPFTSSTAVYAHELAFEYFEGITQEILYDQDRVFVKEENLGDILLTENFRSFCGEHPFKAIFCRKSDPQTKGKVENVVKYVKYNFLKGRNYQSIELLQQECLGWLKRTANAKRHGTTWKIPQEQWEQERMHLLPIRSKPRAPENKMKKYKVRKDNTIAYKGNFYTLPLGTYNGADTSVLLNVKEDNLFLYSLNKELLAKHTVCYLKGALIRNTDHGRDKSNKISQSHQTVLKLLGANQKATQFLSLLEKDKPRYYHDNLKVLLKNLTNIPPDIIGQALQLCLENSIYNGYQFIEIATYYHKQQSAKINTNKIILPTTQPNNIQHTDMIPGIRKIEVYESILK
jgi:transposase